MKHPVSLTALVLASALALAGCGAGAEQTPGGATSPGSAAASAAPSGAASATGEAISAEHDDDDVMFAQMMIPHHEQAVDMSETLLGKDGVPEDVRALAERVVAAQGPEIERLNAMLAAWGAPTAPEDPGHGGHGGGMMTEEDLAALTETEGEEAAALYLEQMTEHHRGAIDMARAEVSGGQNPQAVALAQQIVDAQEAEIQEMDVLLKELDRS